MRRVMLIIFIGCLSLVGCSSNSPVTSTTKSNDDTAKTTDTSESVEGEPTSASTEPEPIEEEPIIVEGPSPGNPPEPAIVPSERFVVLTSDGPLIVEAEFTIDGENYDAITSGLAEEIVELADTNEDGISLWDEVVKSPHFRFGQYGNMAMPNYEQQQQAKRQYDTNLNGRFDLNEVARFLTQGNGGSSSFSLRSSNMNRGSSKRQSQTLKLLDFDEDGKLSEDEITGASARLRSRDANEDELLLSTDFVATPSMNTNMQRRRNFGPKSAILLGDRVDWDEVSYAFQETYGYGGQPTASSFSLVPKLFTQLDIDQDGELSDHELRGLNRVPAHFHVRLRFGRTSSSPLELLEIDEALHGQAITLGTTARRIALQLPHFEIAIHINDTLGAIDYNARAKAQFEQADGDSNGYLDEDELPENLAGMNVPFETLDADGDGKLYLKDLAEVLGQQQAAARSQVHARAADDDDVLFSALDTDNDRRLDSREVMAAEQRLRQLDENVDGTLRTSELPDSMSIVFARGNPNQGNTIFNVANSMTPANTVDAPRWFTRMDANSDGEISESEFLGTTSQFKEYDTNGDGFMAFDEVKAVSSSE